MRTVFAISAAVALACAAVAACAPTTARPGPRRLASRAIALPVDVARFNGPGGEVLNSRCLACHSASMVLTQPRMTPAQWRATTVKMRDVYRAPLAEADIEPIVAALSAIEVK